MTESFAGAKEKMAKSGPRKLLALDGGGIRGLITIKVLMAIEANLRKQFQNPALKLCDYFDFIAGTSTGAVIGTLLATGRTTAAILENYRRLGNMMFDRTAILGRLQKVGHALPIPDKALEAVGLGINYAKRWAGEPEAYAKYPDDDLIRELKTQIGGDSVTLGTDSLRTLLLVVMSDATNDAPWPVSNNPIALGGENSAVAKVPLWSLVRASTAAPMYFPPQEVKVGSERFVFVDGGVTPYNNPALQLFIEATLQPYGLMWPTGEDKILVVSVGTGLHPNEQPDLQSEDIDAIKAAKISLSSLFNSAIYQQDLMCRVLGRCIAGHPLNEKLGDLADIQGPVGPGRLFTYVRYNAVLTKKGLAELGLGHIDPKKVKDTDSTGHMDELEEIGDAVARKYVRDAHFTKFRP